MKKRLSLMCIGVLTAALLVGCGQENSNKNNLISKVESIEQENKDLKAKLEIAQEKIKSYEEAYNLRNQLDLEAYEILTHLQENDFNYLKDRVTSNIVVSEEKLIIKDKSGISDEFILSKDKLMIRERAYMLNEEKTEFHSIYEIRSGSKDHMETLNFKFILKDDKWLLDFIDIDE